MSGLAEQILKHIAVGYAKNGHAHSNNLFLERAAQYVDQKGGKLVGPFLMSKRIPLQLVGHHRGEGKGPEAKE